MRRRRLAYPKPKCGPVRMFDIHPGGRRELLWKSRNLILHQAADAIALFLSRPTPAPSWGVYFEFINLSDPDDPVSAPAVTRADGLSYYTGLEGSSDTDYVRAPLTLPPGIDTTDEDLYSGNRLTFEAQTQGSEGVNGLPFGPPANSLVYGTALVAIADPNDRSKDLVYARIYQTTPRRLKETGHEISVTWPQFWE